MNRVVFPSHLWTPYLCKELIYVLLTKYWRYIYKSRESSQAYAQVLTNIQEIFPILLWAQNALWKIYFRQVSFVGRERWYNSGRSPMRVSKRFLHIFAMNQCESYYYVCNLDRRAHRKAISRKKQNANV